MKMIQNKIKTNKMNKLLIIISILFCLNVTSYGQENILRPNKTNIFATKDGNNLYLDYYDANTNSKNEVNAKEKPAIIFIFGGGFIYGQRDHQKYNKWFKLLTDNGYKVFSIDYRLGLKGKKVTGISSINIVENAINMGVEDLFDATKHIIENKAIYDIDVKNIVVSGSSAGAIIALQAEYYLSNRSKYPLASVLPEDFNYSGVMSFAGAILSRRGKLKFETEPCPTLMIHGTDDNVVPYKQIKLLWLGFFGTDKITERYAKFHHNYNTLRFLHHQHDMATYLAETFEYQKQFLETNVTKKIKKVIDMIIDDPSLPIKKGSKDFKDLYK